MTTAHPDARLERARTLASLGHKNDACKEYAGVLALFPDCGDAHFAFANLLCAERNYADAISHYEAAAAVNYNAHMCHEYMGTIYAEHLHRPRKAEASFQLAVDCADSPSARLLTWLAIEQFKQEDYSTSRSNLERALAKKNNYQPAMAYLARTIVRLAPAQRDIALAYAQAAYDLDHDDGLSACALAEVQGLLFGKTASAMSLFEKAIASEPKNLGLQVTFAKYLTGHDGKRACSMLNAILSDHPGYKPASALLKTIDSYPAESPAPESAPEAVEQASSNKDIELWTAEDVRAWVLSLGLRSAAALLFSQRMNGDFLVGTRMNVDVLKLLGVGDDDAAVLQEKFNEIAPASVQEAPEPSPPLEHDLSMDEVLTDGSTLPPEEVSPQGETIEPMRDIFFPNEAIISQVRHRPLTTNPYYSAEPSTSMGGSIGETKDPLSQFASNSTSETSPHSFVQQPTQYQKVNPAIYDTNSPIQTEPYTLPPYQQAYAAPALPSHIYTEAESTLPIAPTISRARFAFTPAGDVDAFGTPQPAQDLPEAPSAPLYTTSAPGHTILVRRQSREPVANSYPEGPSTAHETPISATADVTQVGSGGPWPSTPVNPTSKPQSLNALRVASGRQVLQWALLTRPDSLVESVQVIPSTGLLSKLFGKNLSKYALAAEKAAGSMVPIVDATGAVVNISLIGAIKLFTHTSSFGPSGLVTVMNKALTSNSDTERFYPFISLIVRALDACPCIPQQAGKHVYVVTNEVSESGSSIVPGTLISWAGFYSGSEDVSLISKPIRKPCTVYMVEPLNAYSVAHMSEQPADKNVIFLPGTVIRVNAVTTDKGLIFIRGTQVE